MKERKGERKKIVAYMHYLRFHKLQELKEGKVIKIEESKFKANLQVAKTKSK